MTCFLTTGEAFDKWYYRRDPTHVVFYAEKTFEVIAKQRDWKCEMTGILDIFILLTIKTAS